MDADTEQAGAGFGFGLGEGLLRPALGVAAAAALVVAVTVGLRDTGPTPLGAPPSIAPTASLGVVRWIDPGDIMAAHMRSAG